jgi:osmotically inducible lipoprotein OsmB
MTTKLGVVSLLAGCIFVSACTLNYAERRAATGGALGAGAGAAGGYLLGYDPLGGALIGGAGGALLGALTTPDNVGRNGGWDAHQHYRHDHGQKKRWRRDYD